MVINKSRILTCFSSHTFTTTITDDDDNEPLGPILKIFEKEVEKELEADEEIKSTLMITLVTARILRVLKIHFLWTPPPDVTVVKFMYYYCNNKK